MFYLKIQKRKHKFFQSAKKNHENYFPDKKYNVPHVCGVSTQLYRASVLIFNTQLLKST
jgi:hypothetical protein